MNQNEANLVLDEVSERILDYAKAIVKFRNSRAEKLELIEAMAAVSVCNKAMTEVLEIGLSDLMRVIEEKMKEINF